MKTIERLRELLAKATGPYDSKTDPWMDDRIDAQTACIQAFPALLAVAEAAGALVQLRNSDQSLEWVENELRAEAALDAALRNLDEVTP